MRRVAAALAVMVALGGPALAQEFTAVLHEGGTVRTVGVVRLDASKRVSIVSARPGRSGFLRQMAEEVNAEDALPVEAPPPPGSPRFADVSSSLPRTDPRFLAALQQHLRTYYDVSLDRVRK